MNRIGRNLLLLVIIGGLPLLSHSQPKGERVILRKVGRVESRSVAPRTSEEQSIIEYPSENGKFIGVAVYATKGEWAGKEFSLRGADGATLWTRQGLPIGMFFVSNQGDVVQRIGEWGGKLQFYSKDGTPRGSYESPHMVQARGYLWDTSGDYFVLTLSSGYAAKTVALSPDGSVMFERPHPEFQAGTSFAVGKTILVVGVRGNAMELVALDRRGNIFKQIPWKKGDVSAALEMRGGNTLLVAGLSCVLLDPELKEIATYTPEDEIILSEAVASPTRAKAIVKFWKPDSNDDAGFVVLDHQARLIGRKELRGKKLKIRFVSETKAVIEADTERYEVDIE